MNQMQAFIEKAKNDKALMAKLNELGAADAGADKIVALAAEHGFSITEEDYRKAAEAPCPQCSHQSGKPAGEPSAELSEEDLEAAAGGGDLSRHDPTVCSQYKEVGYYCVGFLSLSHCWHYTHTVQRDSLGVVTSDNYKCTLRYYDYEVKRY